MTDQQTATMGNDATQVLGNPAYSEAMALLKAAVVEKWRNAPIRDAEGQRLLLQMAKLADDFEAILGGFVQHGKLAQHKIDVDRVRSESKPKQLLRRAGF